MRVILIVVGLLLVGCGGEHAVELSPESLWFAGPGSDVVTATGLASGVVVEDVALDAGPEFGMGALELPHELDSGPLSIPLFFALGGVVDAGEYEAEATVYTSHGALVVDLYGQHGID